MRITRLCWLILFLCTTALVFSSCISTKETTYFNNLPDSARIQLEKLHPPQQLIQVNDILRIRIGGENEKTVEYINQHFAGNLSDNGLETIVDLEGNIELPQIGKIKLEGMTKEQAKIVITNAYKEYLVEPMVTITFAEFRFSVLGEVGTQGVTTIKAEKVSIMEALALSGGLTQYSERENVKIIREANGEREVITVNVNDKNLLNSPDYYLFSNDIIYVAAKGIKQTTENFQRSLLYITGVTGVLTVLLLIFK